MELRAGWRFRNGWAEGREVEGIMPPMVRTSHDCEASKPFWLKDVTSLSRVETWADYEIRRWPARDRFRGEVDRNRRPGRRKGHIPGSKEPAVQGHPEPWMGTMMEGDSLRAAFASAGVTCPSRSSQPALWA